MQKVRTKNFWSSATWVASRSIPKFSKSSWTCSNWMCPRLHWCRFWGKSPRLTAIETTPQQRANRVMSRRKLQPRELPAQRKATVLGLRAVWGSCERTSSKMEAFHSPCSLSWRYIVQMDRSEPGISGLNCLCSAVYCMYVNNLTRKVPTVRFRAIYRVTALWDFRGYSPDSEETFFARFVWIVHLNMRSVCNSASSLFRIWTSLYSCLCAVSLLFYFVSFILAIFWFCFVGLTFLALQTGLSATSAKP